MSKINPLAANFCGRTVAFVAIGSLGIELQFKDTEGALLIRSDEPGALTSETRGNPRDTDLRGDILLSIHALDDTIVMVWQEGPIEALLQDQGEPAEGVVTNNPPAEPRAIQQYQLVIGPTSEANPVRVWVTAPSPVSGTPFNSGAEWVEAVEVTKDVVEVAKIDSETLTDPNTDRYGEPMNRDPESDARIENFQRDLRKANDDQG